MLCYPVENSTSAFGIGGRELSGFWDVPPLHHHWLRSCHVEFSTELVLSCRFPVDDLVHGCSLHMNSRIKGCGLGRCIFPVCLFGVLFVTSLRRTSYEQKIFGILVPQKLLQIESSRSFGSSRKFCGHQIPGILVAFRKILRTENSRHFGAHKRASHPSLLPKRALSLKQTPTRVLAPCCLALLSSSS